MKHKTKRKKIISAKLYNMEEVSLKGFCDFCKNNIPLIISVSLTLFFVYGIKLFSVSIGDDTNLFMADKAGQLQWNIRIGRFGFTLLSVLWHIKEFNPYTAFFLTFCLIWFFTISWCYIIAIFSGDSGKNNKLIPFALLFMSSTVFAEQLNFTLQAAENALIISLCPYIVYLLFKGFLDNEKSKIICAAFLLVFIISVYQTIVLLFCCTVFICFILLSERTDYEPKIYNKLCLGIFLVLLGSLAVYFFIDRIIIPALFDIERSAYLDNLFEWGSRNPIENIFSILIFGYVITIGQIPIIQDIVVNQIITHIPFHYPGIANTIQIGSRTLGNVLLLPATILFLKRICGSMRKMLAPGRRLLYVLAGIGIPFSIMLLVFTGGNWPPVRSLYALPLASAFIFFYLIRAYKKKAAVIAACLTLLIAFHQIQITSQLLYSDYVRYNDDVRLSYELDRLIMQVQPVDRFLPVVIVGSYHTGSYFHNNFLQSELLGTSLYEKTINNNPLLTTRQVLALMTTLGINYPFPNMAQIEFAYREAASMPVYPYSGCVKRARDFIVVKLPE